MNETEWYVETGLKVQGPYRAKEVARFVLLGRIKIHSKVSGDSGETWEPLTQVPQLLPEELTENIDYMASDA